MTFICRQKINFILHIFLELFFYCKDIVNLFWVLWTCLAMHTQSDTINLLKTFVFICRSKNQLHPSCFSKDWLTAFWPINREPEFCQIWDWWWNINNNISFHFRLFPRKLFKILHKLKKFKKIVLGLIWAHFAQIGQKWIFMEKRALPFFNYSNYLPFQLSTNYSLMSHCWQKCWTDGWIDNSDFIGPSAT